jgi:hypothetical protein
MPKIPSSSQVRRKTQQIIDAAERALASTLEHFPEMMQTADNLRGEREPYSSQNCFL